MSKAVRRTRDEFPAKVRKTLAERAAYFCSDPDCLKLTAGPHSDESKSLTSGHAAHIHAASPLGPRYDSTQTSVQRKAISNGLWLCRECGVLVDRDDSAHTPDQLRRWKREHETMIAEVRKKGYSDSLILLQSKKIFPLVAKRVVSILEDRRALWALFDYEFPDRVCQSLTQLRRDLSVIRGDIPDKSELDFVIRALIETIRAFFTSMEHIDLSVLRCDANDPDWISFRDALSALRKSVGMQLANIAIAYDLSISDELRTIVPRRDHA